MKVIESVTVRAIGVALLAVTATACAEPASSAGTLPLCGDLQPDYDHVLPDCRLQSIDGSGLTFTVRYTPGPNPIPWVDAGVRIDVSRPDGTVRQTLTRTGNFEMVQPVLVDLNGDGHQELIVALNLTITGNLDDQVYVSTAATGGKFVLAGEADGTGLRREADGLLLDRVHLTAGSHAYNVYRLTDTELENLIDIEDDPDSHGHHCHYVVPPSLAGTGLTVDQAHDKFCALLTGG